jgi:hypothetical protein
VRVATIVDIDRGGVLEYASHELEQEIARQQEMSRRVP